ncbi:hypothetical protein [Burkholderia ubonensis]|uniref:hypothetical protein n=1 Tax=Burkholderia ubonensis TaxID=101571 RepID=UPI0012FBB6F9|nr:hypothetical protein [Burkholderia ubonensis]
MNERSIVERSLGSGWPFHYVVLLSWQAAGFCGHAGAGHAASGTGDIDHARTRPTQGDPGDRRVRLAAGGDSCAYLLGLFHGDCIHVEPDLYRAAHYYRLTMEEGGNTGGVHARGCLLSSMRHNRNPDEYFPSACRSHIQAWN